MLSRWIEAKPYFGIFASLSGFGASVLSFFQSASIVLGFVGAVFGLLAGYYTWRVKREHWKRIQSHIHSRHD